MSVFFLRQGLALSPRLVCSGAILVNPTSASWVQVIDSPDLASCVAGITGTYHHTWLTFVLFLVETAFYHVVQAGFKLLTSSNPPASASQNAGITGPHPAAWLSFIVFVETGFCYVVRAALELLASSDPPTVAFHSAGIRGMNHHTLPEGFYFCFDWQRLIIVSQYLFFLLSM